MSQLRQTFTVHHFENEYQKVEIRNSISPYTDDRDTLLILSVVGGPESYGKDRSIGDFFETLNTIKFPSTQVSLGLLVGDTAEFEAVVAYFKQYFNSLSYQKMHEYIHKVTILTAPFIEESFSQIDRGDRHNDGVQRLRRRTIARSRNFVLNNVLAAEKFTLFVDSDIIAFQHRDMVKRFIKADHDIVVPRVIRGDLSDYDKNSWVGERTKPNEEQLAKMDNGDWENWDYVPRDVTDKMVHFDTFLNNKKDLDKSAPENSLDFSMKLDSVGGAILFVKSIIYKQGIQFPPNYIVGTTWDRLEGYDGIETEGLCYTAKSCNYSCWGMPNLVAEHSVE
ncbi:hypothetical protein CANTEDRAFT_104804 [Yamadazyma tenuis ATCC 10573]|uniref:Nucleotide-diphospho-sugar transferase n=2 Tax=Candida tenuis TaxID=2315449 RepID=G3B304_CANTC|nr:uncharacterized protein CANTEDRAFT_104804 [Yamadazyma tenuis ATCC 10573]EGV64049.1 hypothetical protein CANTEDRAFT_104804 [Yamadazyma tenuis ATCC 10573]